MAQASSGDTVKIHYTGTLEDGSVFDSSRGREPIQFTIGQDQVIAGFEQAVVGMSPGDSKTAAIPAGQAYGPRSDEMVMEVERQRLPDDLEPEIGMRLQIDHGEGQDMVVNVTEVTDSHVIIDANHPLAGKDLTFELELVEIA